MNIRQRARRTKIIMEHRSSHNYTIVVQLFLIKREFDTPIPRRAGILALITG